MEVEMKTVRRRALLGSNALLVSVVLVLIVALLYSFSDRYRVQFDLSADSANTLLPETRAQLRLLDQDGLEVTVTAFSAQEGRPESSSKNRQIRDLLKQLDRNSDVISWKQVDFDRERLTAEKLGVNDYGRMVIQRGDARVDIKERKMFRRSKVNGALRIEFIGEEEITRALSQLMTEQRKNIYFLQGHGEPLIDDSSPDGLSSWIEQLELERYDIHPLDLLQTSRDGDAPTVPEDAVAVVVMRPKYAPSQGENDLLLTYLGRGGSMLLVSDVGSPVPDLITRLGLSVLPGVAVDRRSMFPYWDRPIPNLGSHPINQDLRDNELSVVLSHPAPFRLPASMEGIKMTSLLSLTRDGWIDRGGELSGGAAIFEDGIDVREQASMAVAVEVHPSHALVRRSKSAARVVAVSDADLFMNALIGETSGNGVMGANMVHWLAGDDRRLQVKIRRTTELRRLAIAKPQLPTLRLLSLLPMPLLSFLVGIAVWFSRRGR
jgi:ABC-type uncharacterized transport system involved in gliding motility auxiliary subunit